ncbi:Ribosomal RNA adenine dimethylase domain containing 1 [Nesidiocoris tenuis]|uniref:Ribosomal RNA adenine dimethylase domain containing 1 n=1 Tax=Nesidiocoris tenuis TaxID=355587 RepID=A0ABN7BEP2_9HEMI|nr:Ribosomal RNA adenine dimethylase domain containing 1 [Nesidiocoris tenuis]
MTFLNEESWDLDKCVAHLREMFAFLQRWKWLVTVRPIDIVVSRTLDEHAALLDFLAKIPLDKQKRILLGYYEDSWPVELKELIVESTSVVPAVPDLFSRNVPGKGTISKKDHETSRLSSLVCRICREMQPKGIVDVGSGLGYVDRVLCESIEGCSILAIESEEARCTTAHALNRNVGFGDRIVQVPRKLFSDNVHEMAEIVTETFDNSSCLIALHACGDLSLTSLKLFEVTPSLQSAVVVPCCYHKMAPCSKNEFDNFPCSEALKWTIADDRDLCCVSFLRLAAESSREMWLNRDPAQWARHARSVAYRALVQSYQENRNIVFRKRKRKAVKSKSTESWSDYAACWAKNTQAVEPNGTELNEETVENELKGFCTEEQASILVSKTLGYNTLRNVAQNVAELFVLVDRLTSLKEQNYDCSLARIADSAVSPRSVAIIVEK